MELAHEYTADIEGRFKYFYILIAAFFLVVVGRLYFLQLMKGSFYRFFSTENSIKETTLPAVRGSIYDREGEVLVQSRPAFDVVATPQYVADKDKMITTLSSYLNMSKADIEAKWEAKKVQPPYQPLIIKEDVPRDEIAKIRAHKGPWYDERDRDDLRGIDVVVRYQRIYPDGMLATHLLGYVREIDAGRLADYHEKYPQKYLAGDEVGISGIEEVWDLSLRGYDGFDEHVVNAMGREINYEGMELAKHTAIAGDSLVLTVDKDVQQTAKELFGEKSGAAVMLDVRDGAVITMYSSPTFDLNELAKPQGGEYWLKIARDAKKGLINRTIQGTYPPGSTFKPVTAIAALSEGALKPKERISCGGGISYGGRIYHCWNKGGHGAVDIHRAIVESCDVFFYNMGLRLGVDKIAKYARSLGLGAYSNIPLPDEKRGLIPSTQWKLERYNIPWQEGETLSVAVGQSYNSVSPLQNALVAAHIANGGRALKPYLVKSMYDSNGNEIYQADNSISEDLPIDKNVLKMVKDAMVGVVSEAGGTAHRLSSYKVSMGGKTGTAQVVQLDSKSGCVGEKCLDHAWFIGFAPAENPEVAVAVVVEHGGFGASAAAPIAGAMMQKYYEH